MSHALPTVALSVRQPWAWAIMHAGKTIENRSWHVYHPARRHAPIGKRVCIHAAQGMTKGEYEDAAEFINRLRPGMCPPPHLLVRGAIIGTVEIVAGITKSDSPWFFGPYGLGLARPRPEGFIRVKGELGWFEWKPLDAPPPLNAKWMQPKEEVML